MSVTVAIDTSADVCVAVVTATRSATRVLADRRAHVEMLIPLLRAAAAEVGVSLLEVTHVRVGVGPGPFTGLRVGVAAAVTLAETVGAEIVGVNSLDVVAAQMSSINPGGEFVVASDARRKEVYWARYSAAGDRLDGPFVTSPDQVVHLPIAGTGASLVGREVAGPTTLDPVVLATADLADVGLEPLYLRRPDADVPTKRKSTLVRRRR